jgi:hypothetical protein
MKMIKIFTGCIGLLSLVSACSTAPRVELEKEDFRTSGRSRTFGNSLTTDSGIKKTELNLEREVDSKGNDQFNFLFSITYVPVIHELLAVPPGGTLNLIVDGEKMDFPTTTGSRDDTSAATQHLGVGRIETIRFQNISLKDLRKISKAADVRFEIIGSKSQISGLLTSENVMILSGFAQKLSK